VLAHRYDLSRHGSVSIAIRVPREVAQQLREAAIASGIDRSTYIRDALTAAPGMTMAAVKEIQWEAAAAERELAASQMQSLRDQVARALSDGAQAREQLVTLEGDLGQGTLRLLILGRRVLRGEMDARRRFAEVWGQLDLPAQEQLLSATIMAIREFLLACPEAKPSSDDLVRQRRLFANVDWLLSIISGALGTNAPRGSEPAANTASTASTPAPVLGRADGTNDAVPGGDPAPPSISHAPPLPHGSHLEAHAAGPKGDDRGQVAGAAQLGGFEGTSAHRARQGTSPPVWASPTVLDSGALLATSRAGLLGRTGARTSTPFPDGSKRKQVEGKDGEACPAEDPPPPPPVEAQEPRRETARGWMPNKSEASADMWL
jgi:hypothetical protein